MNEAERLNRILERDAPAAARCLSDLGRRAYFPRGIPAQAAEAAGSSLNATIGQITDDAGHPMPLDAMVNAMGDADERISWLYSPQEGHRAVRQAWGAHQRTHAGGCVTPSSLPYLTLGLTQGLSLIADLFSGPDTDVLLPSPHWGNYTLLFTIHRAARVHRFPLLDGERFNLDGLAQQLASLEGKAVLVLNLPSNPSGFTITPDEASDIVQLLCAHPHPLVVVCDDAYAGMVWEDGCLQRSLYWDLIEKGDPERLFPVKIDGTTKELFFFPGRVGFLSHAMVDGEAEEALLSKLKCVGRGTVSSPPGPSQALVLKALLDPGLEAQLASRKALLRQRYQALRTALDQASDLPMMPRPFNAGIFALVGLTERHDAEEIRQRLLSEHDAGVVAIPSENALRLCYGSISASRLQALVQRLRLVLSP